MNNSESDRTKAGRRRFFARILNGLVGVFPVFLVWGVAGRAHRGGRAMNSQANKPFPFKRPPDDLLKVEELDSSHPWAG